MATQVICDKCKKIIDYDRNITHIYFLDGYSISDSRKNNLIDKVIDLCSKDREELLEKMKALVEEYSE